MPKKLPLSAILQRVKELNYPQLSLVVCTYKNIYRKCLWHDSEYGYWWCTPKNIFDRKVHHPKRSQNVQSKKRVLPLDVVKDRIFKVWGNVIKIVDSSYTNSSTKCYFIDSKYGKFSANPQHIFNGHGHKLRGIAKYANKCRSTVSYVENKLYGVWKNQIKIDGSTYISSSQKARFIDKKFGEFWALPNNVISKKSGHPLNSANRSRQTSMKNWGTEFPNQNKTVHQKTQKGCWNTVIIKHWKDGRNILCRGSYEYGVINRLNELKIEYETQIKIELKNCIYFCDIYLPNQKKFIEIKGCWWNDRNKGKWEEFHCKYPNSTVWFENDVKNFTKLSIYKIKKQFNKVRLLNKPESK